LKKGEGVKLSPIRGIGKITEGLGLTNPREAELKFGLEGNKNTGP